jgi:hypothetical protein
LCRAGIWQRSEGSLQHVDRRGLCCRIETCRVRLRQQQRFASRRKPDTVTGERRFRRRPALREVQYFHSRIARQQRFQSIRGRRSQIFHTLFELVVQERGIECCRVQRGSKQISVRQQRGIERAWIGRAIEHAAEMRVVAQRMREAIAQHRKLFRWRAIEGEQ